MKDILIQAKSLKNKLVNIRRQLHMYPELGFKEFRTQQFIINQLKELKIPCKKIAKTGVVGLINGDKVGRTIAIRADMDALPIVEEGNKPYKSRSNGVMHACGHDAHVTCLLGVAMLISEIKDRLNGKVKLIFQPCEENATGIGGGELMVKEGVLENPKVNAIVALHVSPDFQSSVVGIKYGDMCANADKFEIKIKGIGSHAAKPHRSIDPIVTASAIVQNLQSIVSRNIDPLDSAVVSITTINAGSAFNIIPSELVMEGTVRTLNNMVKNKVKNLLEKIAVNTAKSFGAECKVNYIEGYPAFANNDEITKIVELSAVELLGKKNIKILKNPSMGGEDFAFYVKKVPGSMFWLGVSNKRLKIVHPLHSAKFDIDEDALPIGVAILTKTCINYLNEVEKI